MRREIVTRARNKCSMSVLYTSMLARHNAYKRSVGGHAESASFLFGGVRCSSDFTEVSNLSSSSSALRFVPTSFDGDAEPILVSPLNAANACGGVRSTSGVRDRLRLPPISVFRRDARLDFDFDASAWHVAWYI